MTEGLDPLLIVNKERAAKLINEFDRWKNDPGAFENKQTLTGAEYGQITSQIKSSFFDRVRTSGLATGEALSVEDLKLVHEIQEKIPQIEAEVIMDPKRRPWNDSCLEHARQAEAVALVMAEEINQSREAKPLDINLVRSKAALHDIGRFASHHPLIHGMAGRDLLKVIGFAPEFRTTTLAHLEAGVGPYLVGIDPETWPKISSNPEELGKIILSLPLEEIIVVLAEISSKGVETSSGSGKFVNQISDPIEGVTNAARRRPGKNSEMYVGFAKVLKGRLERQFNLDFGRVVDQAKEYYILI